MYLRVRLREHFVNPQLLKQLAVYKIKGWLNYMVLDEFCQKRGVAGCPRWMGWGQTLAGPRGRALPLLFIFLE